LESGKTPKRFLYRPRGMLVSVGQKYGVGKVLGIPLSGFFAWWLMRTVYLFKFQNVKHTLRTMWDYTMRLFAREDRMTRRR
jgi:NADH:ubiquinone reductase (H+-translocating)